MVDIQSALNERRNALTLELAASFPARASALARVKGIDITRAQEEVALSDHESVNLACWKLEQKLVGARVLKGPGPR